MFLLFRSTKDKTVAIVARIKLLDGMDHSTIYSRWEADRQIILLSNKLKELSQ